MVSCRALGCVGAQPQTGTADASIWLPIRDGSETSQQQAFQSLDQVVDAQFI